MTQCPHCGTPLDEPDVACLTCLPGWIDPMMVALGRAMAPQVNARLADLERELAEKKKSP